ncbi:DUF1549 domain-containing protein [bacterium]|nr:DUF1549 domain-containing protein [bacterium]
MSNLPLTSRLAVAVAAMICVSATTLRAAEEQGVKPAEPSAKAPPAKLVEISLVPQNAILSGARAAQGLRVTGRFDDGRLRDITADCQFRSSDATVAEISADGLVTPQKNGRLQVTASAAGLEASMAIEFRNLGDASYHFGNDVLPVLERLTCNQMGCHGSPKGKKRLQLSLFSADPHGDFLQITDAKKKLIDPEQPERSWLILKAICEEDHGGGDLTAEGDPEYNLLVDWIQQKAPEGAADDVQLERIDVFPTERLMIPGQKQRLLVEAHYSDGTMRDVTNLAWYKPSESAVAKVDETGTAEVAAYGDTVILVRFGGMVASSRITAAQPVAVPYPDIPVYNRIDELVDAKLKSLNIIPSELSSDAEFLRRVYLDVIGILPTADEARAFLADTSPDKRAKLIDDLLSRPEYADFYALKWGDILQINRDEPARLQDKGMWAYYRWLWNAIDQNLPMDQFVRETLTARGSAYENGPANFFRIGEGPQGMAEHASTAFLGVRLDCAHCHNHPFEQFTLDDNLGMAAFFSQVRSKRTREQDEEVIYTADSGSVNHPDTKQRSSPKYLGGAEIAATEKAAVEAAEADKAAADKTLAQKTAAVKSVADKVNADKARSDKLIAEKKASAKLAADQIAVVKAAVKKVTTELTAAQKTMETALAAVEQTTASMTQAKQAVAAADAAIASTDAESAAAAANARKAADAQMTDATAALEKANAELAAVTQTMGDRTAAVDAAAKSVGSAQAALDKANGDVAATIQAAAEQASVLNVALNTANAEKDAAAKEAARLDAIHRSAVAKLTARETTGDLRSQLVAWIVAPANPYFARHMTNRVWWWLTGRGIVHEPDDFRSTNPASNPELLDYLAEQFIRSGFDMKATFRLILNSRTYQLSSLPNEWNMDDHIHYSHYQLKRLSAEQLAEAISQTTDAPEKYAGLPLGTRATQLPDVSMRSEFLDLFGRPKRATPVESERTCETHIGQSLQMISSEYMARKLRDNNGLAARLAASDRSALEAIDELYLTSLSRFPTDAERSLVLAQPIEIAQRREKFEDLLWVLMNTKEFLFNH